MEKLTKNQIKLFYFSELEMNFIIECLDQIKKPQIATGIAFIRIQDDSEKERINLRRAINVESIPFIIFSSDNAVAKLSWEINAIQYIDINSSSLSNAIETGLKRAQLYESGLVNTLTFKGQKQIDVVNPKDIVFIIAFGNYSELHFENSNKILITKQLGQIEEKLAPFNFLKRFGKSVIVNLNKIKRIEKNAIYFVNNETIHFPKYSKSFVFLKNKLIWKI